MSNTDLQQYNGTASFPTTGNVGTNADPLLLPTDGPLVTADSNAVLQAPVNVSLKRFKDLVLGLRGATIGDFAGAAIKTFKSIYADAVGGAASLIPNGNIHAVNHIVAETGDVVSSAGTIEATAGALRAGAAAAERAAMSKLGVFFGATSTGAGGANPPLATSVPNQLRAKNIPKGWGYVDAVAGAVTTTFGFGNWTVAPVDVGAGNRYRVRFTLNDVMDNATYAPVFMNGNGGAVIASIEPDTLTAAQFDVSLWSGGVNIDVTTASWRITGCIFGQQTT